MINRGGFLQYELDTSKQNTNLSSEEKMYMFVSFSGLKLEQYDLM